MLHAANKQNSQFVKTHSMSRDSHAERNRKKKKKKKTSWRDSKWFVSAVHCLVASVVDVELSCHRINLAKNDKTKILFIYCVLYSYCCKRDIMSGIRVSSLTQRSNGQWPSVHCRLHLTCTPSRTLTREQTISQFIILFLDSSFNAATATFVFTAHKSISVLIAPITTSATRKKSAWNEKRRRAAD